MPCSSFVWLFTVTKRNFSCFLRKLWKIMKDFFEIFHPSIMGLVEMKRFELLTPCVQGRCSPNWSSRTFRYGYLVTTSPQLLTLPSTAASNWFAHRLRVLPTPMVWRAVCTRPGNAFTATFWFAITSNSNFMYSSCRVQSELGQTLWVSLQIALSLPSVSAIVARV